MKKRSIAFLIVLVAFFISAKNSFPPDATPEQFFKWQEDTRALLAGILYNGAPPEAVPLESAYGAQEKRIEYEITEVKYHDRPGHITGGWLARPLHPAAPKLPAIIALHGHGGRAHDAFDPENMYYYGDLLAAQGYIVLALDIDHAFIEPGTPVKGYGPLPKNVPFPAMGQRVWMVKRGIDFLLTLPDVDQEKIGIVGLSNGGLTSMFAAAMDQRIKVCVASGSLIMHERMWHRELLHCRCQYMDKMDGVLDYYDVFALIAPRSLVVQSGVHDPIFPINSARKAFEFIKKAYTIAGTPDMVYHDIHDGKHEFRGEVPMKWFEKYLPIKY